MSDCICGHDRASHDYRDGCLKFLCCNKTRVTAIGKSGSEHDFINHQTKPCLCNKYVEAPSRWDDDMEAGAIG